MSDPENVEAGCNSVAKRPSLLRRHGILIVPAVLGILIVGSFLLIGAAIQGSELEDEVSFQALPVLAQMLKGTSQSFLTTVKQIATHPIAITLIVLTVVLMVAAGITIYYVFVKMNQRQVVQEPVKPIEAAVPTPPRTESRSTISIIVSAIIIIIVFAIIFLVLFKFSTPIDTKIVVVFVVVLLTLLFLAVKFEGLIMPYVLYLPKKLLVRAAQSTIDNVDA